MATRSLPRRKAKPSLLAADGAPRLRTCIIASYPPERRFEITRIVCKYSGLAPKEGRARVSTLPASITFPTLEAASDAVEALGAIGAELRVQEAEGIAAARVAAKDAWTHLDAAAAVLRRGDESCHFAASLLIDTALSRIREAREMTPEDDTVLTDSSTLSVVQFCRIEGMVKVSRSLIDNLIEDIDRPEIDADVDIRAGMLELAVQALMRMSEVRS